MPPMPPSPLGAPMPLQPSSGLAVASLVVGIVAFLSGLIPFWGLVAGGAAVVLAIFAIARHQSKGLAVTGLILGAIAALTSLVMTVVFLGALGDAKADGGKPVVGPSTVSAPAKVEAPATFTMPDLVGKNLQDSQDVLQALGSNKMDQQDASGQGRTQIVDSNWKVCTQEPAAASKVPFDTVVVLASVKNDEACPGDAPVEPTRTTAAAAPAAPAAPSMTVSQKQAVRKAGEYLDFTSFSSSGLVSQLEYEGFSNADATFAVDSLGIDWNEQAAQKAQEYLDFSSFSRSGLIEQLEYEGFTPEQAEYGTTAVGL